MLLNFFVLDRAVSIIFASDVASKFAVRGLTQSAGTDTHSFTLLLDSHSNFKLWSSKITTSLSMRMLPALQILKCVSNDAHH